MGKRVLKFIPNTPVLVTCGQKPMTGQLSDFINGRTEGNILNYKSVAWRKYITGSHEHVHSKITSLAHSSATSREPFRTLSLIHFGVAMLLALRWPLLDQLQGV